MNIQINIDQTNVFYVVWPIKWFVGAEHSFSSREFLWICGPHWECNQRDRPSNGMYHKMAVNPAIYCSCGCSFFTALFKFRAPPPWVRTAKLCLYSSIIFIFFRLCVPVNRPNLLVSLTPYAGIYVFFNQRT